MSNVTHTRTGFLRPTRPEETHPEAEQQIAMALRLPSKQCAAATSVSSTANTVDTYALTAADEEQMNLEFARVLQAQEDAAAGIDASGGGGAIPT